MALDVINAKEISQTNCRLATAIFKQLKIVYFCPF